jgi:hypothetical protein
MDVPQRTRTTTLGLVCKQPADGPVDKTCGPGVFQTLLPRPARKDRQSSQVPVLDDVRGRGTSMSCGNALVNATVPSRTRHAVYCLERPTRRSCDLPASHPRRPFDVTTDVLAPRPGRRQLRFFGRSHRIKVARSRFLMPIRGGASAPSGMTGGQQSAPSSWIRSTDIDTPPSGPWTVISTGQLGQSCSAAHVAVPQRVRGEL